MDDEYTVFVVDDDAAVRDALRLLLERAGYRVEVFESAEAFLTGYRAGRYGCLVLDVRMGGLSGFGLQTHMPSRNIDLPVIFLTGHANVSSAVRAMEHGAVTLLEKPMRSDVLLHYVEIALARHREDQEQSAGRRLAAEKLAMLTPRERNVAELLVKGLSSKEIARRLRISPRTAEAHRAHIRQKTGARSEAELTRIMLEAKAH